MKQTAVEWLYSFMLIPLSQWPDDMWAQAKAMEKEHIGRAYQEGLIDGMNHTPKDYYNKTYGGKDEL
jgi:hypothetical protein